MALTERAPTLVPRGLLVAHALGSVGGLVYTNSLEALQCNHKRGFRWFEVDLALTSDNELVCFHPGMEENAGMKRPIDQLTLQEVEATKYAGKYSIPRFSMLLAEAERLGEVVLVTDTKAWPPHMVEAVKREVQSIPASHSTRFALQSYGANDIGIVKQLSRDIGGDILLTLYMSGADDVEVEALAYEFGVLAVVADVRRFTPWLAERLNVLHIPILVHTINDHREILKLTRAGADGFYTDLYRPYEAAALDPASGADCDAPSKPSEEFAAWIQRDAQLPGDYWLTPCAKRSGGDIELSACDHGAAISGPYLAVPPSHTLRVDLDVEAGPDGSNFWVEVTQKNRAEPLRAREPITLIPNEHRSIKYDLYLPDGSPGVETRLGLSSEHDRLLVHRLTVSHGISESGENTTASWAAQKTP
jgi:glycerophosphoryl diester phosphodiesterase